MTVAVAQAGQAHAMAFGAVGGRGTGLDEHDPAVLQRDLDIPGPAPRQQGPIEVQDRLARHLGIRDAGRRIFAEIARLVRGGNIGAVNIVQSSQVAREPWANGGGHTRTLLAWPDPRHWWLRVSVADVERAGPFSVFPGVDRWIAVIEGDGVCLRTLGRPPAVVGTDAPDMHAFPGDATTECELTGKPTRDLNVMARRHVARATVRSLRGGVLSSNAELICCFVCGDATLRVEDGTQVELPRHSLTWVANPVRSTLAWNIGTPVPRGWWIEATRISGDAAHGA